MTARLQRCAGYLWFSYGRERNQRARSVVSRVKSPPQNKDIIQMVVALSLDVSHRYGPNQSLQIVSLNDRF